ncbi:hypothetical protein STEG23_001698 [Scotinomys teguina]
MPDYELLLPLLSPVRRVCLHRSLSLEMKGLSKTIRELGRPPKDNSQMQQITYNTARVEQATGEGIDGERKMPPKDSWPLDTVENGMHLFFSHSPSKGCHLKRNDVMFSQSVHCDYTLKLLPYTGNESLKVCALFCNRFTALMTFMNCFPGDTTVPATVNHLLTLFQSPLDLCFHIYSSSFWSVFFTTDAMILKNVKLKTTHSLAIAVHAQHEHSLIEEKKIDLREFTPKVHP